MADQKGTTIIIKKIKKHGHGHHGGAWKVAYADFVTAMMAFFMVMWLMGADDETKKAIEDYFKGVSKSAPTAPFPTEPKVGETTVLEGVPVTQGRLIDQAAGKTNVQQTADNSVDEVKDLIEETVTLEASSPEVANRVDVSFDAKNSLLKIAIKDAFDSGDAKIRRDFMPLFKKIGRALTLTNKPVRIEGHADKKEVTGKGYANHWELSSARAAQVVQFWMKMIPTLDPSRFQTVGNGSYRSIASSQTEEGRGKNRRVEIQLLGGEGK